MATAAKFVQPILIFWAYLVTLDVDVVPVKVFHFRNFRHLLYDELHSFSTFFALNFDKKLAVE
jgi:hypothetical protein